MANHVGKVVMTLLLIAAMAISFNLYRARKQISDLLGKWGEACDTILSFAKKLEIGDEINLDGYSLPLVVNFILLQACQGKQDPRELAKAPGSLCGPAMDEGARFMRFASAAYGTALMAVFGLIPRPSAKDMADMAEKGEKQIETDAICEHTGVQPADLLVMETESLDVAGDADCLRHIVCVDRAAKAVVLALRGTASISDAVHDAVAHATPFCGGFAHAGMAAMARVVWTAAGVAVVDALRKEPSFELIVTGHSLGAGTSGLLTLMLYHLRKHPDEALPPPPPAETAVRCFAFAPPPVFMPLSKAPPGSLDAVNAFVYNCDCVPFISVRAGREMFAATHALDDSCREHLAGADAAAGSSSLPRRTHQDDRQGGLWQGGGARGDGGARARAGREAARARGRAGAADPLEACHVDAPRQRRRLRRAGVRHGAPRRGGAGRRAARHLDADRPHDRQLRARAQQARANRRHRRAKAEERVNCTACPGGGDHGGRTGLEYCDAGWLRRGRAFLHRRGLKVRSVSDVESECVERARALTVPTDSSKLYKHRARRSTHDSLESHTRQVTLAVLAFVRAPVSCAHSRNSSTCFLLKAAHGRQHQGTPLPMAAAVVRVVAAAAA